MIIEEMMKTDLISLTETDTIQTALQIIAQKKIRHIPVVDSQNHLIGLVTDRDLRDAAPSILHLKENEEALQRPLTSIMKTEIITGHPLDFVEETAALLCEYKISCLPIVKEKKLVGILTDTDLLHTLVELTGANKPGSQIEVRVPDRTGALSDIASLIKGKNSNINSILVYSDKKDEAFKILAIRVRTMDPSGVAQAIREKGYEVLWPNPAGYES
ncbi:acetoin utilization AcuB family protein [Peribacillus kribbensis]|uniref:acetoin utilization AcuB family protein n=1 Tax=Peribacillus kribbensis TaxID=356658 RepID=UPI0003F87596|nr:acetoin utilization AcuB family protein [Peribacillus kribbensis]